MLIVGAGGGVNSTAIQLAKILGAHVIALTSSPEKEQRARQLGATHTINYRTQPEWAKQVRALTGGRGADVIVDNVGAATIPESLKAAARGGRIVTVGNTSGPMVNYDNRYLFSKQLSLLGSTMGSRRDFEEVLRFLETGELRPVIDVELPMSRGVEAFQRLERGEQFGKIVLSR